MLGALAAGVQEVRERHGAEHGVGVQAEAQEVALRVLQQGVGPVVAFPLGGRRGAALCEEGAQLVLGGGGLRGVGPVERVEGPQRRLQRFRHEPLFLLLLRSPRRGGRRRCEVALLARDAEGEVRLGDLGVRAAQQVGVFPVAGECRGGQFGVAKSFHQGALLGVGLLELRAAPPFRDRPIEPHHDHEAAALRGVADRRREPRQGDHQPVAGVARSRRGRELGADASAHVRQPRRHRTNLV
mmetsp:Transcript_15317/g.46381  ORF Transcript_15317/g.46381 Transcript_15317/m.46381 type:complete len:241 (-) Transcript_15317:1486-2208(-)